MSPFHEYHCASQRPYDLVCIGFGPASLSIAVALHDRGIRARVLFLEQQLKFAWHSGMLLPGSHMQISFLKDMATFRDPRSKFTFLNYLHVHNRLVAFTNQSTFFPLREEFNDYLSWCASHFGEYVRYGEEVVSVSPIKGSRGPVGTWDVVSKRVGSGQESTFTTKHVVVAVGGRANIPDIFRDKTRVLHSSKYLCGIAKHLPEKGMRYRIAVIGGGQSAVEVFQDLHAKYPKAETALILRQPALRPSDDSPFVNEIFDPDQVEAFYDLSAGERKAEICRNLSTNYSVVRHELIESLYKKMYQQRLRDPNESRWQHRILPKRNIVQVEERGDKVYLDMRTPRQGGIHQEQQEYDLIVLGTGYVRNSHDEILSAARSLIEGESFSADRNYRVKFKEGMVLGSAGIWLQGCCESTHGLSDTLLSVLANRGRQIVDSIFSMEIGHDMACPTSDTASVPQASLRVQATAKL